MRLSPLAALLSIAGVPLFSAPEAPTSDRPFLDFHSLAVRSERAAPARPAAREGLVASLEEASVAQTLGCAQHVAPWDLVLRVVDGTFAPGGGSIVLVENSRCGAPEGNTERVVFWVSDEAAVGLGSVGTGTIGRLDDLDGDGFDEVIAVSSTGQAHGTYRASIGSIAAGHWQLLQQLGDVASRDPEDGTVSFSVLSREPGEPRVRQDAWTCDSIQTPRANCHTKTNTQR